MAIEFTEKWSTTSYDLQSAQRGFDVIGTDNEVDARASMGIEEGDEHPKDSNLIVSEGGIKARSIGPTTWEVTVSYVSRESSDAPSGGNALNEPATWKWNIGVTNEKFDRDFNKVAITNSALDPFEDPIDADVSTMTLVVERYEKEYNVIQALEYSNSVNNDQFKVCVGKDKYATVPVGTARLLSIIPVEAFSVDKDKQPLRVSYSFEFRKDGWKARVKDQGNRILIDNDAYVPLLDPKTKQPFKEAQPLNGKGGRYGKGEGLGKLKGPEIEDTGSAVWLKWQVYAEKSFNALGLI